MADEELIWMAGCFDGEGSVSIVRVRVTEKRKYLSYTLDVQVANTEMELVMPFSTRFGGRIRKDDYSRRWKPVYKWHISAKKAAVFLRAIQPYVRSARKQEAINVALEFQRHQRSERPWVNQFVRRVNPGMVAYRERQEAYWRRVRELNQRGRPVVT